MAGLEMSTSFEPLLDQFLRTGAPLHVAADGLMSFVDGEARPVAKVLLPGSFQPIHRGHWALAHLAEQLVGQPAAFELSVVNVDKPMLTPDEIRRRLAQFEGRAPVWLTRAPQFIAKAAHFPGAIFVVGADTALRIVSPRYYENDEAAMLMALERIRSFGSRFLVACRADERGQCWTCADLPIPPAFRALFEEIPPERFRVDLSSTELRSMD